MQIMIDLAVFGDGKDAARNGSWEQLMKTDMDMASISAVCERLSYLQYIDALRCVLKP